MAQSYSVSLDTIVREHNLAIVNRAVDYDRVQITTWEVSRPGLPLAGFYDYFDATRVQIIGKLEITYLMDMRPETRSRSIERFISSGIRFCIVAHGMDIPPEMLSSAQRHQVTLLTTEHSTSDFMAKLIVSLNRWLAPRTTMHGVLMEVHGEGVMITGESGVGKSENAMALLSRGHRLVADDAIEVKRTAPDTLVGSSPELIRYFMEIRGIGLIDARHMFGIGAVKPDQVLMVVDAMTGQDAVNTAKEFNDRLDFDGVVLTKLDGDTRGGAAISIRSVVSKPLKFISSGEKMDALQVFHPERMADRILGMGDVVSLVERAQEQFDEEEARRLKKKLVKNQFNFNDFIGQIQQIKKMGNLKDLAGMLPGVGKMLKNVDIPDDVFKQTEAIVSSMTPAEREHPEIINARRRERIAKGSGTTMADVNRLMKQFEDTRKMMKAVAGGNMKMPNMPGRRR